MWGNLVIACSLIVAGFTALEVLLSDKQKKTSEAAFIRLWSRLDDLKRYPLTDFLRQRDVWRLSSGIMFGILLFVSAIHAAINDPRQSDINWFGPSGIAVVALLLLVVFYWSSLVADGVGWLVHHLMPSRASWMFWIVPVVAALAFAVGAGIFILFMDIARPLATVGIILLLASVCLGVLWVMTLLPLLLVHSGIAGLLLSVAEFVTRRLAEYPKGPLLAVSVLVGVVGIVLKTLGT